MGEDGGEIVSILEGGNEDDVGRAVGDVGAVVGSAGETVDGGISQSSTTGSGNGIVAGGISVSSVQPGN